MGQSDQLFHLVMNAYVKATETLVFAPRSDHMLDIAGTLDSFDLDTTGQRSLHNIIRHQK